MPRATSEESPLVMTGPLDRARGARRVIGGFGFFARNFLDASAEKEVAATRSGPRDCRHDCGKRTGVIAIYRDRAERADRCRALRHKFYFDEFYALADRLDAGAPRTYRRFRRSLDHRCRRRPRCQRRRRGASARCSACFKLETCRPTRSSLVSALSFSFISPFSANAALYRFLLRSSAAAVDHSWRACAEDCALDFRVHARRHVVAVFCHFEAGRDFQFVSSFPISAELATCSFT